MNRKGQALVEFVLILPVFLFILFVIIDFGIIFSNKSDMENISNDIYLLVMNGEDYSNVTSMYDDVSINIEKSSRYYNILIEKQIDLITPGLDKILGDPYVISVKRVVPNE